MSDKIISLFPGLHVPGGEPIPGLVDMLEDLVKYAKSGELREVAIVGVLNSGEMLSGMSLGANPILLLGGLAVAQKRILDVVEN